MHVRSDRSCGHSGHHSSKPRLQGQPPALLSSYQQLFPGPWHAACMVAQAAPRTRPPCCQQDAWSRS